MKSVMSVVRFSKPKAVLGGALAVAAYLCGNAWCGQTQGLCFAAIFLLLGCVKLEPEQERSKFLLNLLWTAVMIYVTCYISTELSDSGKWAGIAANKRVMNFLCVLGVSALLLLITGKPRLSMLAVSFALAFLCMANGFIYKFRGRELMALDFLSIGTAMNVASQYTFTVYPRLVYGWLCWAAAAFAAFCVPSVAKTRRNRSQRAAAAGTALVCFCGVVWGASFYSIQTWGQLGSSYNGYYLNFYMGIRDSLVSKPDSYSLDYLAELEERYAQTETTSGSKPNVIVIMNEAFGDFETLGRLNTNEPVTPYLDSLTENIVRGHALVPVYGGNTANSEFEFLTGLNMHYFPRGSIPYNQYIDSELYSIAWLMESLGYTSFATHPHLSDGWSRTLVYPRLGFAESTFVEAYPRQDLIRGFVSDQEMYEYVLQALYGKGEAPLFLFGITMQNHGGYDYPEDMFAGTISLEGYSGDYPQAEQYLSLMNLSDKALEYLITELEAYPEDTIVLFFGDHLGKVEDAFLEELVGGPIEDLQDKMMQYSVPFFLWANYEIPEETIPWTNLSNLGLHLLEYAGIELPAYYRFLADLREVVPAMNIYGYYSAEQETFLEYEEAQGEEARWLEDYAILQYNNMFDEENRSEVFFGQYLPAGE